MAISYHFDIGLDPDHRIAQNAEELIDEKRLVRLNRYENALGTPAEMTVAFADRVDITYDLNAAAVYAAGLLRDCYGKIDHVFVPLDTNGALDIAGFIKTIKAFKKKIKVHGVRPEEAIGNDWNSPDALCDDVTAIAIDDCNKAAKDLNEYEEMQVSDVSAAVLFAGTDFALTTKDKHHRIVMIFPESV